MFRKKTFQAKKEIVMGKEEIAKVVSGKAAFFLSQDGLEISTNGVVYVESLQGLVDRAMADEAQALRSVVHTMPILPIHKQIHLNSAKPAPTKFKTPDLPRVLKSKKKDRRGGFGFPGQVLISTIATRLNITTGHVRNLIAKFNQLHPAAEWKPMVWETSKGHKKNRTSWPKEIIDSIRAFRQQQNELANAAREKARLERILSKQSDLPAGGEVKPQVLIQAQDPTQK